MIFTSDFTCALGRLNIPTISHGLYWSRVCACVCVCVCVCEASLVCFCGLKFKCVGGVLDLGCEEVFKLQLWILFKFRLETSVNPFD